MKRGDDQQMRCPKCGWYGLRDTDAGADCKVCGYKLTPGERDKFRLFQLLREESGKSKSRSDGTRGSID
jgi:DNA-directed RNA polymerase subunit RPC12/RpoP